LGDRSREREEIDCRYKGAEHVPEALGQDFKLVRGAEVDAASMLVVNARRVEEGKFSSRRAGAQGTTGGGKRCGTVTSTADERG
jgi:hypothetical protein